MNIGSFSQRATHSRSPKLLKLALMLGLMSAAMVGQAQAGSVQASRMLAAIVGGLDLS